MDLSGLNFLISNMESQSADVRIDQDTYICMYVCININTVLNTDLSLLLPFFFVSPVLTPGKKFQ